MFAIPAPQRSVGDVLDSAIRLYRRSLLRCLPIVIVGLAATTAIKLLLAGAPAASPDALTALDNLQSPRLWLEYLALAVPMAWMFSAMVAQIDAVGRGSPLATGTAMLLGLRRAPAVLAVWILLGVMLVAGLLLFIVPGIYLWGLYLLAVVPAVIEHTGVLESFATSARLIKGNWWRAGSVIFAGSVIVVGVLLAVVFTVVIVTLMNSGIDLLSADPLAVIEKTHLDSKIDKALLVVNLFTATFPPAVLLALYYDLKPRGDGDGAGGAR